MNTRLIRSALVLVGLGVLYLAGVSANIVLTGTIIAVVLAVLREAGAVDSTKDQLTNLYNRAEFVRVAQGRIAGGQTSVVCLDIDQFNMINESVGTEAGDYLLQRVASRLAAMHGVKNVGRIDGDEFGIILDGESDRVLDVVESIIESFKEAFELENYCAELSVTLGIASSADSDKATDLLRFAGLAMAEAKRTRKSWLKFKLGMENKGKADIPIRAALRNALDNDELVLEYQPKVAIPSLEPVGAEALIRWYHPAWGRVAPDKFIPSAEQQGMICRITDWVVKRAILDLRVMRSMGVPLKSISVNVSPYSVINGEVLTSIAEGLAQGQVEAHELVVEITETSIQIDSVQLIKMLTALDTVGVKISIDDFGTGQASLVYLKYLPTSEIKIDKTFINTMLASHQDYSIVKALIELAHDIGCTVCAEGVEDKETLEALVQLKCDTVQGYYIAKPLSIEAFSRQFGNCK